MTVAGNRVSETVDHDNLDVLLREDGFENTAVLRHSPGSMKRSAFVVEVLHVTEDEDLRHIGTSRMKTGYKAVCGLLKREDGGSDRLAAVWRQAGN